MLELSVWQVFAGPTSLRFVLRISLRKRDCHYKEKPWVLVLESEIPLQSYMINGKRIRHKLLEFC